MTVRLMQSVELAVELADAICNLPPPTIDRLRSYGIPDSVIFGEPLTIGVSKIQTFPDGFYRPHEDGDSALIIAAGTPGTPIWITLDDLIAFHPETPGWWWRRRGEAQILGAHNIRPEPVFPLQIHETPRSWLQAGAKGICIVNWSFNPERLLFAGPLEVESDQLKARLEQRIRDAAVERFQIAVSEGNRYAA
jgi:hypothetical protein